MTAHLLQYLANSIAFFLFFILEGASLRLKHLRVQTSDYKTNLGSGLRGTTLTSVRHVEFVRCRPARSAAAQALRGGYIKVQIRAAAARRK